MRVLEAAAVDGGDVPGVTVGKELQHHVFPDSWGGHRGSVGVGECGAFVGAEEHRVHARGEVVGRVGGGGELGGEGAEDRVVSAGHAVQRCRQDGYQFGAGHHPPRPEVDEPAVDEQRRRRVRLLVEVGGGGGEVLLERSVGGARRLGSAGRGEAVDGVIGPGDQAGRSSGRCRDRTVEEQPGDPVVDPDGRSLWRDALRS